MNERMRFNPAEAGQAGAADASNLIAALGTLKDKATTADLLNDALLEIIGLAVENRIDECQARLSAFCAVIGPVLFKTQQMEAMEMAVDSFTTMFKTMDEAEAAGIEVFGPGAGK
jgi:hypothetical protein